MAAEGWIYQSLLLLLALPLNTLVIDAHSCAHNIPQPDQVVHNVYIEPAHVMRKRSVDQQLRIHTHYDRSVNALHDETLNLVKGELIPDAIRYWEKTLRVRKTGGPIRLLRQCKTDEVRFKTGDPYPYCVRGCRERTICGETLVPEMHLESCRVAYRNQSLTTQGYAGEGVLGTDFILYISANPTDRCSVGTTVAYAAYCQLEGVLDKPVAGYINLCPDSISTQPHDVHQMVSTIKHEILHALGFSAGLFAFFRFPDGEPMTPRSPATGKPHYNKTLQLFQWSNKVVRTVVRDDWMVRKGVVRKEATMVVTPNVVREVRRHFNCSTLEGAELEDQGILGTKLTHWEKRIFENEVMTGTYTQNPLISRVTLALMEDTGWYGVDYSQADSLQWGRNLGCDFVTKSCLHWMDLKARKGEHIHPFCNRVKRDGLQTECTDMRDAVALCNLIQYTGELPDNYQHFHEIPGVKSEDGGQYAGSVELADYCPYIQEFTWKKGEEVLRGSHCNIYENNADPNLNYMLEWYGNQSACFEHVSPWSLHRCRTMHSVEHWGSGCYRYDCSPDKGLSLLIAGRSYACLYAGQELDVSEVTDEWLHEGRIICPPCAEVCKGPGSKCPSEVKLPARLVQADRERVVFKVPCNQATVSTTTISVFGALLLVSLSEML